MVRRVIRLIMLPILVPILLLGVGAYIDDCRRARKRANEAPR